MLRLFDVPSPDTNDTHGSDSADGRTAPTVPVATRSTFGDAGASGKRRAGDEGIRFSANALDIVTKRLRLADREEPEVLAELKELENVVIKFYASQRPTAAPGNRADWRVRLAEGFVNPDVFLQWLCTMLRCANQSTGKEWMSDVNPRVHAMLQGPLQSHYEPMAKNDALSAAIAGPDTINDVWPKIFGPHARAPVLDERKWIVMFHYGLQVSWQQMNIRPSLCNERIRCVGGREAQPFKLEGEVGFHHSPTSGLPPIFRFPMPGGRALFMSGMDVDEALEPQINGSMAEHLKAAALPFQTKECTIKMLPVTQAFTSEKMGIKAIEGARTTDGLTSVIDAEGACGGSITIEGLTVEAAAYAIAMTRNMEWGREGVYKFYNQSGNQFVLITIVNRNGAVEFQVGFSEACIVASAPAAGMGGGGAMRGGGGAMWGCR